jgi:hypothetical protein
MTIALDIYSIIGWIGMVFVIVSYIFYLTKKLKINYVLYHLLNFIGATGLAVSTFITQSWPALTLSLIFMGISVVYIIKILSLKPSYRELRAD